MDFSHGTGLSDRPIRPIAARWAARFAYMSNITSKARGTRVLVVEDDRLLRHLAVETLCDDGFAAIGVENAAEALERLASASDVALLITDINMPGMSGLELARVAQQKFPQVQLLLISGRMPPDPGLLPQPFSFLQKPFSARSLLAQVRHLTVR